jgi:hypothetical protein
MLFAAEQRYRRRFVKLQKLDVGNAVARIAKGSTVNGTVEAGGPGKFRLGELVRQDLAARNGEREAPNS